MKNESSKKLNALSIFQKLFSQFTRDSLPSSIFQYQFLFFCANDAVHYAWQHWLFNILF